jgi:putative ABC transport system permease protein
VAAALAAALPGARIGPPASMQAALRAASAPLRWFAWVLLLVSAAALLLCSGGMYAVVAYTVKRRSREIGVRMALGAPAGRVVRYVLGDGLRLARTGTLLGSLAAVGVALTLAREFRGIRVLDLPTWLAVTLLLSGVTLLASWRPARRAASLDPAASLRGE